MKQLTYDDFLKYVKKVMSKKDFDEAISENEKELFDNYIMSIRKKLPKVSKVIQNRQRDHYENMFGAFVNNGVTIVRLFRTEYTTLGFRLEELKTNFHIGEHKVLCQYDLDYE